MLERQWRYHLRCAMLGVCVVSVLLGLSAGVESALAAPYRQGDRILDVQLYHPRTAPGDFLNVAGSAMPPHGSIALGAYFTYMLHALDTPGQDGEHVSASNQLGWELLGSVGLWERLLVEVSLPVSMVQTCGSTGDGQACNGLPDLGQENFEGGGFGDIRLGVRGQILRAERYSGFGLGASLWISFPTAGATAFVGEGNRADLDNPESNNVFSPTGSLLLLGDYTMGRLRFGANAGYLLRRSWEFLDLNIGHQILYGAAIGYAITSWIEVLGELNGRVTVQKPAVRNNPHEILLASRLRLGGWRLDLGVGAGLIGDFGAPDFRLLCGFTYTGKFGAADTDSDGLVDAQDKCVRYAEDKDGYQDEDGCPDLDDDDDGIPDELDRCPRVPAVTGDGCPPAPKPR